MPQQAILRFSSPSVLRLLLDCSSGSILLGARNGLMNFKNWDMVSRERKIALLIDAENISPHRIGQIIAPAKNNLCGLVTVKRIYADWTKPNLSTWKAVLKKHAFLPIQQYSFTSGKNSTDFALVIDAMDLLYQNDIDVFYIVSSDSDFTRLAMRIRESGKMVIGMGEKKTPESFVMACHDYIFFDGNLDAACSVASVFISPGASGEEKDSSSRKTPKINRKLIALIKQVVSEAAESDGWAQLSSVSSRLLNKQPDFNVKNYGYNKFIKLIEACESSFLIDREHLVKKNKKTIKRMCLKNK